MFLHPTVQEGRREGGLYTRSVSGLRTQVTRVRFQFGFLRFSSRAQPLVFSTYLFSSMFSFLLSSLSRHTFPHGGRPFLKVASGERRVLDGGKARHQQAEGDNERPGRSGAPYEELMACFQRAKPIVRERASRESILPNLPLPCLVSRVSFLWSRLVRGC